jgi:hypothetical protein
MKNQTAHSKHRSALTKNVPENGSNSRTLLARGTDSR